MIEIALLIIAVCEIIRIAIVIVDMVVNAKRTKTLNNAFIDSLRKDNKQFAKDLLTEFIEEEADEQIH